MSTLRESLSRVSALALLLCATYAWAVPPPNDDISGARVIPTVPFTDTVDTREATVAPDDPECAGRSATVWYAFTPTTDMVLEANTFGSNYDTTVSVYTGSPGSLNQIACNDDAGSLQSQVIFNATAGVTYYFMVGAFGTGPGGDLVFRLQEFTPLAIDLHIDDRGYVSPSDGTVTISGTFFCSKPATASVFIRATQRAGRLLITGESGTSFFCEGETPWSVTLQGTNGRFTAGRITVSAFGFASAGSEFLSEEETRVVRLSGTKPAPAP